MSAATILADAGLCATEPARAPMAELVTIRIHRPAGSTGEEGRNFVYAMVGRQDAALASVWHAWPGPKPFGLALEDRDYRVTCWDGALLRAFVRQTRPTAAQTTITPFAALGEGALRARWRIDFRSPCCVRRAGQSDVLPHPPGLLRALARRWAAAGQPALALHRVEDLVCADLALRAVGVQVGRYIARGCLGCLDLDGSRLTAATRREVQMLLGFAALAGLGGQTTAGLGAVAVEW